MTGQDRLRSRRTHRSPRCAPKQEEAVETEVLPKEASLAALEVQPREIRLRIGSPMFSFW